MYTKIIKNTNFLDILYTKIVQIKILYDNECTRNVHQFPTYMQKMYKLYKTKNSLKLEMYVFCTYTQCMNYTKYIHMLIKSYMWLSMYVFCIYENPTLLPFRIFTSTTLSAVLFYNFVNFRTNVFIFKKVNR